MNLIGVLPRAEEGRDVFRDPDKESDEQECRIERHPAFFARQHGEVDARAPEKDKNNRNEQVTDILHEVIGEEVDIDSSSYEDTPEIMIDVGEPQIKYAPSLRERKMVFTSSHVSILVK